MSRASHFWVLSAALLILGGCEGCDDGSSELAVPPSAPPTGLTATALSTARIDLTWTDTSDNEALFIIERSTDNVTFVEIARVFLNSTAYVDRPLDAGTTYYYRVLAGNSKGVSAPTNTATATTAALTWTQESPAGGPGARIGASAVYDPVRQRMIVMGGQDSTSVYYNDVWALSLPAPPAPPTPPVLPVWTLILPDSPAGPPRRYGHVAIYDADQDRMVVFGGQTDTAPSYLNDVWYLSLGASPGWSAPVVSGSTLPRLYAAGVYDPLHQELLVYGGEDGVSALDSAAALSLPPGSGPTWRTVNPTPRPSPRMEMAAVFDESNDRMLIFGGTDGTPNDETHALQSGTPTWTALAPLLSPAPICGMQAVLDTYNRRMVFWSGDDFSGSYPQTLWSLNLDGPPEWTPILSTSPMPGRIHYAAVYDALHRRMVVFGGEDASYALTNSVEWIGF